MICQNCGAVFMEGSPFCPNCNISLEDEVKKPKQSVKNKGSLSGDVLLSESGKTVLFEENSENISKEDFDKPSSEYTAKSYSLRKEDVEDAERIAKHEAVTPAFNYTDGIELDEDKSSIPPQAPQIPAWKIKEERKVLKRNVTSAHEIGTVQGGKILPQGLSPNDFMKLPYMSKIRFPYFLGIIICYFWMAISLIITLLISWQMMPLLFIFIVLVLTLLIQFTRSKIASSSLIVLSLFYLALTIYGNIRLSVITLIVAGIFTLFSTIRFEKLYNNYLETQTIPDDINAFLKKQ